MNVLFIYSDQQHKEALGKINPQYITPNIDGLCGEGVTFTNAYSSNPICGPYRGCLMTGQYSSRCDVLYNAECIAEDAKQLAEVMQNAGYSTSYVGKYHLGGEGNLCVPENQRKGFEKIMAYQCYNGFRPDSPYDNAVVFFDENDTEHQFDYHRTDVTTDLALSALEKQIEQDKPFFSVVSYQAPHYPEQPSDKYYEMYKKTNFVLPDDYIDVDPYTELLSPRFWGKKEDNIDYQKYGNNMMEYMRYYAGLCTQIDVGVGRILDLLKEKGVYEDTMIIYTSDHGDMQGSRGLINKCVPYERSCGVPMIIKHPDGRQNEYTGELIGTVDLYKTLADVVGASDIQNLDGKSMLPYILGDDDKTQDYVISEYTSVGDKWRMIRDRKYKLVTYMDYSPRELYDMVNDKYEQVNLATNKDYEEVIAILTASLKNDTVDIFPRERKPIVVQKGLNRRD